jgi:hypothetical protein
MFNVSVRLSALRRHKVHYLGKGVATVTVSLWENIFIPYMPRLENDDLLRRLPFIGGRKTYTVIY